ncbi:histidine kinase [Lysinibacillus fusiformis]|uniref:histidine kinase n=1 Tax=Lysinibacillus fusiformis TaxID=28031 RepID=UPI00215A2F24|nr:histidine kinase [Lysinibacillus fusiformis]MCR8852364.1 histidine kinase [Lysinibacillus fusiformis]WKT78848.1 histidine kinase [Lysinibacillus fusiformis]
MLRKYLSMISLLLFSLFIVFAFITPIVVNGTSEIGDIVVISLIIASFLAALFSQKGKLRILALIVSLIPVLLLVGFMLLPIFYLLEQ